MTRKRSLLISLTSLIIATSMSCLPSLAQSFGDCFSSQSIDISANSKNDEMRRYVAGVVEACSHRWPNTNEKFSSPLLLSFVIERDGTMKRLKLERSSGCEKWDKKAIAAVQAAQPFGRMPFDYRRDVLFVRMEFMSGPPVTYTFIGPSMLG
ncbi:MAG: TonB C-terminal domain-containing protein, partial [Cyanobacteria bacterium]|nr:TonB C-terminal domain-containing protein [Cyanobacteriota bacterium]